MYKTVLVVVALVTLAEAFYLPGVSPVEYLPGEPVPLKVNKLVSSRTQIPYPYYSLNFCKPESIKKGAGENLGEILMGDQIENSPYVVKAGNSIDCTVLCQIDPSTEDMKMFSKRIHQEYRVNWLLDNLPAAVKRIGTDFAGEQVVVYETGFPLGIKDDGKTYLNNHVDMLVLYHTADDFVGRRIVGFEVTPQSIRHEFTPTKNSNETIEVPKTCLSGNEWLQVDEQHTEPFLFTYSVDWEYNSVKWSSRWDIYLSMTDTQIHWFSIINSLLILVFLSGMVAMIIMRTLHADIRNYRDQEPQDEETGWKLVHGDVFRPPPYRILLAVLIGSGVQVMAMTIVTLVFSLLGFLSPANRGSLITAAVVLYLFMALCCGYASARMYKVFKGTDWKKNAILSATLLPFFIFFVFCFLNFVLGLERSSGYVHFGTLLGIVAMWFAISIPLGFYGSYLGFKKPVNEPPVRTNQIPRQIPEQIWYMRSWATILMGGILPFGAVFIELFFILSSIWQYQFYYMFGFLFIVFLILVVTCAEITVVMCYFQLCSEDYRWWWRSYLTSGASAFYFFLYGVFYFFTRLDVMSFASVLLYFGYNLIFTALFFVLTGTIGFFSCYYFVSKIYAVIKAS